MSSVYDPTIKKKRKRNKRQKKPPTTNEIDFFKDETANDENVHSGNGLGKESTSEQDKTGGAPSAPQGPSYANLRKKPGDLDSLLAGETGNIVDVRFSEDFSVVDDDVIRLVNKVGPQLTSLRLGSSDTGAGVYLTDAAVMRIVSKCPNLTVLQLDSCTGITNEAFIAVCRRLTKLRELHCTGHDRTNGRLTAKALAPIGKENALPNLQRLYLTDQRVEDNAVQRLMKKRKGLRVLAGATDSDSFAWGSILRMTGRSYGDGLYGNLKY